LFYLLLYSNNDGYPDFVVNGKYGNPDVARLFVNNKAGGFTTVTLTGYHTSEGLAAGDYNGEYVPY